MLDVFLTVDVEIWCNGWQDIDVKFPGAFERYIYGHTASGDFALPFQCKVLNDHGLTGVFFVEPLFSGRFGIAPLAEIVGLLRNAGQEVQIHLHTEWVDEARVPLLPGVARKRQYLRDYTLDEQRALIAIGRNMLAQAGAAGTNAFRAGGYGFNRDTLRALAGLGIPFDSSYNARLHGLDSGVMPGVTVVDVIECEGVMEYPITVFRDGTPALRPTQLAACSFPELRGLLWQALERRRQSFTIVSHNFELLNPSQTRADWVAIERFRKLCAFLEGNRDCFRVSGFRGLQAQAGGHLPEPLVSPFRRTARRILEQAYRRRYH